MRNSADTVEKCQAACINNGSCTGVDWDGNTGVPDGQKCWLSGPWSGDKGQAQGVTHYTLNRNCAVAGEEYITLCVSVNISPTT